jgi:hypothetical protein
VRPYIIIKFDINFFMSCYYYLLSCYVSHFLVYKVITSMYYILILISLDEYNVEMAKTFSTNILESCFIIYSNMIPKFLSLENLITHSW